MSKYRGLSTRTGNCEVYIMKRTVGLSNAADTVATARNEVAHVAALPSRRIRELRTREDCSFLIHAAIVPSSPDS